MAYLQFPLFSVSDAAVGAPSQGARLIEAHDTSISRARSGREQRRALRTLPRYRLVMPYRKGAADVATVNSLFLFHQQTMGALYPWAYAHHDASRTWSYQPVGTGDGVTTAFNLPCVGGTARTMYLNGVAVLDADVTYSAGSPTNNYRDIVTFDTAPASPLAITVTFTGRRWFLLRFERDDLDLEQMTAGLYNISLDVVDVIGE